MRHLFRLIRLTSIALLLVLTLAGAQATLAQGDGTPTPGTPTLNTGPGIGDEVSIFDSESLDEIATVTVDSIIDPFEDYEEFAPPEAGTRFIGVEFTITNLIANDSIDPPIYELSLLTTEGLLVEYGFVVVAADADIEEFPTDSILGNESANGFLFFALPEDAEIAGVYYTAYGQFTLLAGITETVSPELGDIVTASDVEGNDYAAISVTEYVDRFEDYDEFSAPERGQRVVAVTVEVENLIANDGIDLGPETFSLVTADGFQIFNGYTTPSDDSDVEALESTRLGGGETGGGTIFFIVPEDAEITGIIFSPDYQIFVNLGNPSA